MTVCTSSGECIRVGGRQSRAERKSNYQLYYPIDPTLVWEGRGMNSWYAVPYAVVITDDADGMVVGFADILKLYQMFSMRRLFITRSP